MHSIFDHINLTIRYHFGSNHFLFKMELSLFEYRVPTTVLSSPAVCEMMLPTCQKPNWSTCRRISRDESGSEDEGNSAAIFDFKSWGIAALSVRLMHMDTNGFDHALVMVPVASQQLGLWTQKSLNAEMAFIGKEAWQLFKTTPRFKVLSETGCMCEPRVGMHKRNDTEVHGYNVVGKMCRSDRPSFLVEYNMNEDTTIELMHFYPAMGLQLYARLYVVSNASQQMPNAFALTFYFHLSCVFLEYVF